MDPEELAFAGLVRQAELVRSGEVSARELVELCLERIARLDSELNAFRTVSAERARADADQADARRAAGDERPLLGVPLAVKDNMDVAGEVTRHGTAAYERPAERDCELVARLRAAGAVFVGRTNLPELAIMGSTEGPAFGITRNPWDLDRTPGGSSGGSAAAVAAGLCAAGTASDGAGSIRNPAACCHVFGLKPQRGRVPLAPLTDHWHGLSVFGFVTRSVRDSALLLDLTADGLERPLAGAAATAPGRLRIAMSAKPALLVRPPRVKPRRALAETGELLRSLGHEVIERDPDYGQVASAGLVRYLRGIGDDVRAAPRPERLQRRTRGFGRLGAVFPDPLLRRALAAEPGLGERINRIFDDVDVLITPLMATLPPRADEWEGLGALRTLLGMGQVYPYGLVWNVTGQPAAVVPAGLTEEGVPRSVQLVGRPDDEATLVSLAAQLEAETGWLERRPPIS